MPLNNDITNNTSRTPADLVDDEVVELRGGNTEAKDIRWLDYSDLANAYGIIMKLQESEPATLRAFLDPENRNRITDKKKEVASKLQTLIIETGDNELLQRLSAVVGEGAGRERIDKYVSMLRRVFAIHRDNGGNDRPGHIQQTPGEILSKSPNKERIKEDLAHLYEALSAILQIITPDSEALSNQGDTLQEVRRGFTRVQFNDDDTIEIVKS